jgi:hypothetical protein
MDRHTHDRGDGKGTARATWMCPDEELADVLHPFYRRALCQAMCLVMGTQQQTYTGPPLMGFSMVCAGGQILLNPTNI